MSTEELFKAEVSWNPLGKKFTYKEYSRQYTVRSQGKQDFIGTAAPSYLGTNYHYNPEDLMVVSLSACHMLTYLAYAANMKIEVLSYTDAAEGVLHQEGKVTKFKEVTLNPKIKLAPGTDAKKAESLHEKAHKACFIANSINFPIIVNPQFS